MRIAAYEHAGVHGLALVREDGLHPLGADVTTIEVLGAMARGESVAPAPGPVVPIAAARLLAPLQPPTMRDFICFEAHVFGAARAVEGKPGVPPGWEDQPTFCFMSPYAVVGTETDIPVPFGCELLDFELELAAVVGLDGRDLTYEEAANHIAGYLIMNDWSARDLQSREMKLGLGPNKGKDFATTLGPWLVSKDELESHVSDGMLDLGMSVSINGVVAGGDRSAHMAWTFPELVSYASRHSWVKAGDVLASGTCATGALVETWGRTGTHIPPPLKTGDVVEMTIEGIGTIRNTVGAERQEAAPIPRARRLEHLEQP